MNQILPLALLLAAAPVAPLSATADQPVERRFDVGPFDAVELSSSDTVHIIPGDTISVTAGGDPRALDALTVEVRGSALHVGRRPGRWRDRGATITIMVPAVRAAAIDGSGDIRIARVTGADFSGRVSGSGELTLPDVRVGRARLSVSGSGSITASGSADRAAIDVGGSGRVDARGMSAVDATIGVGGSGGVRATATRTATVSVGGSGSARVTGGAECVVSRGGSGSASCG